MITRSRYIEAIIEAFRAKNKLDILVNKSNDETQYIIGNLTKSPIKVNGFLTREQIYEP